MQGIIDILKRDIAITFEPADIRSIKFANTMLSNHGFPSIPEEYSEFLKITNGLIWNGVELYGTKAFDRELKEYSFPGIIDVNMDFMGFDALPKRLIVGRAPEELIVYSSEDKNWQCMDRIDFSVNTVYPYFKEILASFIEGLS